MDSGIQFPGRTVTGRFCTREERFVCSLAGESPGISSDSRQSKRARTEGLFVAKADRSAPLPAATSPASVLSRKSGGQLLNGINTANCQRQTSERQGVCLDEGGFCEGAGGRHGRRTSQPVPASARGGVWCVCVRVGSRRPRSRPRPNGSTAPHVRLVLVTATAGGGGASAREPAAPARGGGACAPPRPHSRRRRRRVRRHRRACAAAAVAGGG